MSKSDQKAVVGFTEGDGSLNSSFSRRTEDAIQYAFAERDLVGATSSPLVARGARGFLNVENAVGRPGERKKGEAGWVDHLALSMSSVALLPTGFIFCVPWQFL